MAAKTKTIGGPYRPPKNVKPGDVLQTPDGRETVYALATAGLLAWPAKARGGRLVPILHGDLVLAVRNESVEAVCALAGVSRWTVQDWRRRCGVGRFNAGTLARWRELAPAKLGRKSKVQSPKSKVRKRSAR
ncbi:MAG: hypothetical protein KGL35_32280 [Bradyrhizobium sp.]|nr:hypothetical protein [Bradyrhizobium sp.]